VISSPYLRCRQTVEPLAAKFDLTVETDDALAEERGTAAMRLVRSVATETVVLCTHGDIIPEILVALADEDRVDLGPRPKQAKGSVWVLESDNGRFHRAQYLPPPE
jgi:broad specificity phosphatase PhoE